MFGIAFDPDRPLVATSAFPDGTVAAGEVFDWRARGMQPLDVFAMFRSGLLAHPSALDAQAPVSANDLELPGVTSATVAEKLTRAERKALRRQQQG